MAITRLATSSLKTLNKYDDFLAGNAAYNPSSFYSIATVTAAGGETSLSFTSIPSTYKSLQIRGIARATTSGSFYPNINLNSDTGSNYSNHVLRGSSGNVYTGGFAAETYIEVPPMSSTTYGTYTVGAIIVDIIDYASISKNKTVRIFGGHEFNSSNCTISAYSGAWYNTSAITRVDFYAGGDTFQAGSTYALYGVK